MAKHQAPERHPARDRRAVRTVVLAMIALTMFVVAMIASYSGAFAKPTLHHLSVAVAAPERVVDGIRDHDTLDVTQVRDDASARASVYHRDTDAGYVVTTDGRLQIYVAGGGGHSVASAAETVGRAIAHQAHLTPAVIDVAPASAGDPSGTVEFYAVIFISIGASVGAALLGAVMGKVRRLDTLVLRSATLTAYSAVLAGVVTVYVDAVLGALTGHTWQVFGVLWLYSMAVAGAVTGVSAAFGAVASAALTAFLVVVGNAAAAGPVGRPLLSGFYSTCTAIVPQGSGVSLLRSVLYFGGNGAQTPLVTLAVWGAAGCLLAIAAVTARLNYGARYDHLADPGGLRGRALLRPRVLSPAD
jgi:hypothetical protein